MESRAGVVVRVNEDVVAGSEGRIRRVKRKPDVEVLVIVRQVHLTEVGPGRRLRPVAVSDGDARPIAKGAVDGDAFERAGVGGDGQTGQEERGERVTLETSGFHRLG